MKLRVMVVEWPDGLAPSGPGWEQIAEEVAKDRPDFLVTNEMPFGAWLPSRPHFETDAASQWVRLHEQGLEALSRLAVGAVISTRPVSFDGRLANEAFSLIDGRYLPLHHKRLFPAESGWHESHWFGAGRTGFEVHDIAGMRIGILICTELMFNEHARHLGRSGADLIAVPRATGQRVDGWETAARMAALVGGCYVATSNRRGQASDHGPVFGGHGFVVAPGGFHMASTTVQGPMLLQELDPVTSRAAKLEYPCYVREDLA